ncbi:NTP transferase domain-containing protein [Leucobacter sp. Z1108]|uniref:NTP transferase domain-containing protein n=1 Tax=Leucobacter sp. Z1108 TaxID=3439066 RepID=UPI003F3599A2
MVGRATDAIILAGGRGSRLGGIDKAELMVRGERQVDRVVAAAREAGVGQIVVVGPERSGLDGCTLVTESPRFGGPLVALAVGMSPITAGSVLLLACDLVHPAQVVDRLLAEEWPPVGAQAVVLRDLEGRAQWLAGRVDAGALRAGLAAAEREGELSGRPLRDAFRSFEVRFVDAPDAVVADIDTPQDLARTNTEETPMSNPTHLPPEALEAWLSAAAREVGLDTADVSIATVLDLARDVAHGVARPAAPLTTFLLGLAYGRAGAGVDANLDELAASLTRLAADWGDAAS